MQVRVRFAPSPTGSPHVGNLRTAIYDWLLARRHGGVFIARLEDTDRDPARYRPEYITDIEESLRYLRIEPDEWWISGGPHAPYVQSERLERYRQVADELISRGRAYRCFCTEERLREMRDRQQAAGGSTGYDRRCRSLTSAMAADLESSGAASVVRLAMPMEGEIVLRDLVFGDVRFDLRLQDDPVLLKSNGWPTYHLAAMTDDHDTGITHVLRGEDWMSSAPKHLYLFQAMGWDPPAFAHLPLIVGTDRKKLSKRHGATQFTEFITAGYLPDALFNFLVLLGWSAGEENREIFSREELIARFGIEGISRSPAVFDYDKLRWMNGEYIRAMPPEQFFEVCVPWLAKAGLIGDPPSEEELSYAAKVISLVSDRIKLLSELAPAAEYFFQDPESPDEKGQRKWLAGDRARDILNQAARWLALAPGELSEVGAEVAVDNVVTTLGIERAPVIHTLRIAATGRTVGPGLFETLSVLGKSRVLRRIERAKDWILD